MTLFQKIAAREIPADIVHEDELCLAFRDISPQAPVHILVVPKKLLPRLGAASLKDRDLLGHLLFTAADIARRENLDEGFRIVINNGPHGGETVPHLHVHLLGGRPLSWPPG
jgi:histidine triad (HIT) family protein